MKALNFSASLFFTVFLLIVSAALASNLRSSDGSELLGKIPTEEKTQSDDAIERSQSNTGTPLTLEVKGIRTTQGKVMVMVFDEEAAYAVYDYSKAAGYQEATATKTSLHFSFPSLTQGPYAIFVMHDENDDHQLNEVDGYPIEGFATSGASSKYDEPSFNRAAVAQGKYKLELVYF